MAYKKTAPSIQAESGSAQLSTSRRSKGSKNQQELQKRCMDWEKRIHNLLQKVSVYLEALPTDSERLEMQGALWRYVIEHQAVNSLFDLSSTVGDIWDEVKEIIDKEVQR